MSVLPRRLVVLSSAASALLLLWLLCSWLAREWAGFYLGSALGLPVTVRAVHVGVFPPDVTLRDVTFRSGTDHHHAVLVVGSLTARPDFGATDRWPPVIARLDVRDVSVAPVSVVDAAARLDSGPPDGPEPPWDRPGYGSLPDEARIAAAIAEHAVAFQAEVQGFRTDLHEQTGRWRQSWSGAVPAEQETVMGRIRTEWSLLQNRHEHLLVAASSTTGLLLDRWGLSESAWVQEATLLTDDRIMAVLQSVLGMRGLLGWTRQHQEPLNPVVLPPVRHVVFSGQLWQAGRAGSLQGEIMNAGGTSGVAPTTLAIRALGDRLGHLTLTASLQAEEVASSRHTLALSWQDMQLEAVRWVDRPAVDVVLGDARLSLEISGTLSAQGILDVSVRQVWSASQVEVVGSGPDLELLESLASILQSAPDITVTASITGALNEPRIQVNSDVRDRVLTLIRERRAPEAAALRQRVEARLQAAFTPLLLAAEPELLAVTAFLDRLPAASPTQGGVPFPETSSE